MLVARAAMVADPGASRKGLAERANRTVTTSKVHERLHHAKSLASQGELHHLVEDDAATLWSETVQHLPRECLKFALNAAQYTLPHNANLAIWRREGQCKLCSERQTLSHVLNHCKVALDLRRYNARHDVVLMLIADFVKSNVSRDAGGPPGHPIQLPPCNHFHWFATWYCHMEPGTPISHAGGTDCVLWNQVHPGTNSQVRKIPRPSWWRVSQRLHHEDNHTEAVVS